MRIISKFSDYYDGVQHYGQDKSICYIRDKYYPDEIISFQNKKIQIKDISKKIKCFCYDSFIIGFCGEFFPAYIICITNNTDFYNPKISYEVVYSKKELDKFEYYDTLFSSKNDPFFTVPNANKLTELFFKYNTPCFILSEGRIRREEYNNRFGGNNITINPMLKKYSFYKVRDTYTAFQDISMFVGGVLPDSKNDMIGISNKDMIRKKGFDEKSFRKAPTKKKR